MGPEKGLGVSQPASHQSPPHTSAARTEGRSHRSPRGLFAGCARRSRLRRRSGALGALLSSGAGGERPLHDPLGRGKELAQTPRALELGGGGGNRQPAPRAGQPSSEAWPGLSSYQDPFLGFQKGKGTPARPRPAPRPPPRRRRISMSDASGPGTTRGPRLAASQPRVERKKRGGGGGGGKSRREGRGERRLGERAGGRAAAACPSARAGGFSTLRGRRPGSRRLKVLSLWPWPLGSPAFPDRA